MRFLSGVALACALVACAFIVVMTKASRAEAYWRDLARTTQTAAPTVCKSKDCKRPNHTKPQVK